MGAAWPSQVGVHIALSPCVLRPRGVLRRRPLESCAQSAASTSARSLVSSRPRLPAFAAARRSMLPIWTRRRQPGRWVAGPPPWRKQSDRAFVPCSAALMPAASTSPIPIALSLPAAPGGCPSCPGLHRPGVSLACHGHLCAVCVCPPRHQGPPEQARAAAAPTECVFMHLASYMRGRLRPARGATPPKAVNTPAQGVAPASKARAPLQRFGVWRDCRRHNGRHRQAAVLWSQGERRQGSHPTRCHLPVDVATHACRGRAASRTPRARTATAQK